MAFTDATLKVGADAIAAHVTYWSVHTTGAVTSSANESTAPREAVTWSVDADGDLTASADFTGGAASGPAVRIGYWTASSGGTYCGGFLCTGDTAFNAAGEFSASGTETGTSS